MVTRATHPLERRGSASDFGLIESECWSYRTMNPMSFPVWLFVNQDKRTDDGYPYYLWMRGGEPTPLPAALPVFSTERIARQLDPGSPFKMVEVDSDTFYDTLKSCRNVEDVVLDMGTDNAVLYRVEELLGSFGSDSAAQS